MTWFGESPTVAEHKRDVPPGADWRKPDDPAHLLRVHDPMPDGFDALFQSIEVAGVTMDGREPAVRAFVRGRGRGLDLVREPKNEFDKNAIAVYGLRSGLLGRVRRKLGYVPREVASELVREYSDATYCTCLDVVFLPVGGRSPGIRFDIGIRR